MVVRSCHTVIVREVKNENMNPKRDLNNVAEMTVRE